MIDQRRLVLSIGLLVVVGAGGVPAVGAAPANAAQFDWP